MNLMLAFVSFAINQRHYYQNKRPNRYVIIAASICRESVLALFGFGLTRRFQLWFFAMLLLSNQETCLSN